MIELKQCPFCGNEHPLIRQDSYGVEISCTQCQTKFRCDCTAGHDRDKEETIKRWNKRTYPIELYSEHNKEATQRTMTELHEKWKAEPIGA